MLHQSRYLTLAKDTSNTYTSHPPPPHPPPPQHTHTPIHTGPLPHTITDFCLAGRGGDYRHGDQPPGEDKGQV